MKQNVTFIISNIDKALAFEWIAASLNKENFSLNFILLNPKNSELENFLIQNKITVDRITYRNKKDVPKAIYLTYKILKKQNTTIVHTHLFDANIIGLIAAWLARIPKRIHTRHHSNSHHLYHPQAVKYDTLINWLSTDIVAISEVVKNILMKKENVKLPKIHLIHHGFLLEKFTNVPDFDVNELKKKYSINDSSLVVGVISRYLELKGVHYIIPAFEKITQTYPNALLILANTNGDYKNEIKILLQNISKKNFIEIPFELDIFSLYKVFDIFIHVPISSEIEAFGQTYIEALASEVPSIFTLSGIANEFIVDRQNALVVPYQNSDAIYKAMIELVEDNNLANKITSNGLKDVNQRFDLNKMIVSLEALYEK